MKSRTRQDCCNMLLHIMTTNLSLLLLLVLFLLFTNNITTTTNAVTATKATRITKNNNNNHPIQCFLDSTTGTRSTTTTCNTIKRNQKQQNLLESLSKWWTQSPSVATIATTKKYKQTVYNRNSNSNCCHIKNNNNDDDSSTSSCRSSSKMVSSKKKSNTINNHSKKITIQQQKQPIQQQQQNKRRRFLQQLVKTVAVLYTSTKITSSSNVNAEEITIASTTTATSTATTPASRTTIIPSNLYQFETARMIPRVYFEENKSIYGYVERVIDGDTIRITHVPYYEYNGIVPEPLTKRGIADCTISIRLYGIDTPEIAKKKNETSMPFGIDAKQYTSSSVFHKMIKVTLLQKDKYGRAIGAVETVSNNNSIDLSIELAKSGLAELYTGGNAQYWNKKEQLQQAIAIAKRNKVGIWSLGDSYISIADYKRNLQIEKQ